MKYCIQCKVNKPRDLFYKRLASPDNLSRLCKVCIKINRKVHYSKNKSKILKQKSKYYQNNSDIIKLKRKVYVEDNRDKINKLQNDYDKRRIREEPMYRLRRSLKTRCYQAFKRNNWQKLGTQRLLGCSVDVAFNHIEGLFQEGMSWDNHGEWHIDHKIPLASAETEYELINLCHYKNLQPLWALDNILKSDKII